jgi:uncharacterized protein (DUF1501 family)
MQRRTFLQYAALGSASWMLPELALANADTESRFVLVILRGALDGLGAVPPYGDGNYAAKRGALAITSPTLKLDGMFALHPSLAQLHSRYQAKELLVFHAAASPYRERSHFDGQDLLESGTAAGVHDGWLNRMLPSLPLARTRKTEEIAVAVAQNVPLVLRGDARVNSWAPSQLPAADSDTLERIADLYASDPLLSSRLQSALAANSMVSEGSGMNARDHGGQFKTVAAAAGKLLSGNGSRIAVMDVGGWDTHANQGAETGQLAIRLRGLDQGLETLRTTLGPAWTKTAVLVVTEFGRTVAVNGTRGTDHGTGTCAFLLGGAVAGGKVIADWPGLANQALYQGRDLQPTLDLRSVFKGVLATHLSVKQRDLEERVFPGSRDARLLEGLIKNV